MKAFDWQKDWYETCFSPHVALIGLVVVLILCWLLPLPGLTYERDLIADGEWYRILTGQFTHRSLVHLLANLVGVCIAWWLFVSYFAGQPAWHFWMVIIVCAWSSGLGLWLFAPHIEYYVGFSGTLYGVYSYGAFRDVIARIRFGWLILLTVIISATWEYFVAPIEFLSPVRELLATPAHFFGMVGGLLLAVIFSACHWYIARMGKLTGFK